MVFYSVAQGIGIAVDKARLQRLAFCAELEVYVIKACIAVKISVALHLAKTPFTIGLR